MQRPSKVVIDHGIHLAKPCGRQWLNLCASRGVAQRNGDIALPRGVTKAAHSRALGEGEKRILTERE